MNSGIIYDARKIKLLEAFESLTDYCGFSREWGSGLWLEIVSSPELTEELFYYLENNAILGKLSQYGYTLLDLYFYCMDRYNLVHDTGKNTADCSKERLVLLSFEMMKELIINPEKTLEKLGTSPGMDRIM